MSHPSRYRGNSKLAGNARKSKRAKPASGVACALVVSRLPSRNVHYPTEPLYLQEVSRSSLHMRSVDSHQLETRPDGCTYSVGCSEFADKSRYLHYQPVNLFFILNTFNFAAFSQLSLNFAAPYVTIATLKRISFYLKYKVMYVKYFYKKIANIIIIIFLKNVVIILQNWYEFVYRSMRLC